MFRLCVLVGIVACTVALPSKDVQTCTAKKAVATASRCLRQDPLAASCLVNGGTPCECLTVGPDVGACFGDCYGEVVQVFCGMKHNANANANIKSSSTSQHDQETPPRMTKQTPAREQNAGTQPLPAAARTKGDIRNKLQQQLKEDESGGPRSNYNSATSSNNTSPPPSSDRPSLRHTPQPPLAYTPPSVSTTPSPVCYRTPEGCGDWWGATTETNTSAAVSFSSHASRPTPGWVAYARVAPRLVEDMEYNGLWQETVFDTVVADNGKVSGHHLPTHAHALALPDTRLIAWSSLVYTTGCALTF